MLYSDWDLPSEARPESIVQLQCKKTPSLSFKGLPHQPLIFLFTLNAV